MRIWNTIAGKFIFTTVVFIFLCSVVFIILFNSTQKNLYEDNLKKEAVCYAEVVESSVVNYIADLKINTIREHLSYIKINPLVKYVYVLDQKGRVITDGTYENPLRHHIHPDGFTQGSLESDNITFHELETLLDVMIPVDFGTEKIGYIKLGFSKERMLRQISDLQSKIIFSGILIAVIGSIITLLFMRLYSRPIKQYISKIKEITHGNLDQKVEVSSYVELKQLSESFNEMTRELKETRGSLIQAKEEAEQASKLKTEFLAQMSHEIRSPINTILSFTSLMKEDLQSGLPEEYNDYFNSINNAGSRITRTIDMILDLSEVQTGTYETRLMVFDIAEEVLKAMVLEYKSPAEKKGLKISLNNGAKNTMLYADQYMVSQVFQNLIDNAIKYSQKGKITVDLKDLPDNKLEVKVVDTGIGISEEFISNLFDPFRQEEQGYSRRYDGSGLGLALVKKYCELNNATINVESKKGVGSTFKVVFEKYDVTAPNE